MDASIRNLITLHEKATDLENAFAILDKWTCFDELSDQLKAEHSRLIGAIMKAEKSLPTWYN